MADIELAEVEVELKSGDIIVLHTDGVNEATNARDEQFGHERLMKAIRDCHTLPAEDMIRSIRDEVIAFAGEQPQFDDITLMLLKVE
jgi:sigma-B regulation protein RsbU (phosphoserine phosphatase)